MVKSIRHKHELSQLSSNTEDQTSAQNAALVSLGSKQSLPRSRSVSHDPGQMHLGTSVYLAEGRPPFCEQPLFVQKRLLRSRRHSSSYTGTPASALRHTLLRQEGRVIRLKIHRGQILAVVRARVPTCFSGPSGPPWITNQYFHTQPSPAKRASRYLAEPEC